MSGLLKPSGGEDRAWRVEDFPEGTNALHPLRIVGGDRLRSYSTVEFERGAAGIAWFLNRWFINGPGIDDEGAYGLIDVLAGEDIVGEIGVADARTFQRLKVKLGCRVESTDGDPLPQPTIERNR